MHWFRNFSLILVLIVPACGELPQPFEHGQQKTTYPLAELAVDVRVLPVKGFSRPAGRALARAVAINLGAFGVTGTHRGNAASRFILDGTVTKAYGVTEDHATLLIQWTLRERGGEETGIHVQELHAVWLDWESSDTSVIIGAAASPAKAIAGLVGVDAELPPSAIGKVSTAIFIHGVAGAPGDGNKSLAVAIRRNLSARGAATFDSPDGVAFIVRATVKVDPPNQREQRISIVWRVDRPNGDPLGEASQVNTIPAGSLDGKWGAVAGYVAAAAVDGIQEILDRSKASETSGTITVPPNSNLVPPTPTTRE